ncbi:UPF0481 protein At3g47200 [Cajanus cajan]|nr:UPF0481 protein At3g47200 [Cajanus cajan]
MTRTVKRDDDVMIDIKAMLDGAEVPVTNECCIYKVPFHIRRLKADAYTPNVVSIGPFHHNSHPRLLNMERHKLGYCKAFLQRTNTTWHSWICYIKEEVEPHFHRFYLDTLDEFSKEELIKIIFVDSGFILELFCRYHSKNWSKDDVCLSKSWLESIIRLDLLLLENQLPFSLLESLFNKFFTNRSNHNIPSFIVLTFDYFDYFNKSNLSYDNTGIEHFTDLIRTFHLQHPPQKRPSRTNEEIVTHLPSATELSEAGVRIKVNKESECLLNWTFSGRVLRIPELVVEDWTEILFRNMVAFEQCHYPDKSYITDYVAVMDFLINTSRDVDILVRKGVLVNWLGDADSVADLFNGLMKNIVQTNDSSEYFRICKELSAFQRNPWHNLKSTLRRDYCKSPWQTAATIAGILLLILSLIQSVCSVLQVIQQYNAPSKTW